jgi:uroporphyrinogen decarboxylase
LVPDRTYEGLVAPSELGVLEAARLAGGRNILHVCGFGGVRNRVGFFAAYGADAFNWAAAVEGLPLSEGRRLFPGRVLLGGFANHPGSLIHQGDRKAIQDFTRGLIADAGPASLIIGADCSLPAGASLERLGWAREAAAL